MHGQYFNWNEVAKNTNKVVFEKTKSSDLI